MTSKPPPLSPRAEFDGVLAVTRELVENRGLWWKLSAHVLITPRLEEDAVSRAVGAKNTNERGAFERILLREIVPALNRAIGSPMFGQRDPDELQASDKKEFEERSKKVEEALYSEVLKERVTIRRTCKGPTLEEMRWDISIKKHDLNVGSISDVPYATVEMVLVPEANDVGPLAFLGLNKREVFAFDCHLHDLDALLHDLTDLKKNLEKLTAERKT